MEVQNDHLTTLVNSQNHKNKEVMHVVREWVGILPRYNIHCVARTVIHPINNNHPFLLQTQAQPLVEDQKQPTLHPQQVSIQDWNWL